MKIRKAFNTTKKEIESKKFNIYIGISIGNKWFTKENLREYLNWALKYTKSKVLFLIADKIHAINYGVRNKKNRKNAIKKAINEGSKIELRLSKIISKVTKKDKEKIEILRWSEYEKEDKFYSIYTPRIYKEFKDNLKFKKEILNLVKSMINDRKFSKEGYLRLSEYLLEEFVALYSGINLSLNYYNLYIYPQETKISKFLEKIQKRKIFPELNKKLPKEKVALAIVN